MQEATFQEHDPAVIWETEDQTFYIVSWKAEPKRSQFFDMQVWTSFNL